MFEWTHSISEALRRLLTPKRAREAEDTNDQEVEVIAREGLPPTPPPVERQEIPKLKEAQDRLQRIQEEERRLAERMDELAAMYERREESGG